MRDGRRDMGQENCCRTCEGYGTGELMWDRKTDAGQETDVGQKVIGTGQMGDRT